MSYMKDAMELSTKAGLSAFENLKSEFDWRGSEMDRMAEELKQAFEEIQQKNSVINSLELSRSSWKQIAEDAVRDSMDLATRLSRIGLRNFDYQKGVKDE